MPCPYFVPPPSGVLTIRVGQPKRNAMAGDAPGLRRQKVMQGAQKMAGAIVYLPDLAESDACRWGNHEDCPYDA